VQIREGQAFGVSGRLASMGGGLPRGVAHRSEIEENLKERPMAPSLQP